RLPEELQDAAPDGPAPGSAEDDPRARQAARGPRPGRRAPARAGRGDHPLDDAARTARAARDRRLAAQADRGRLRHDRRAGEPADRGPEADGEDDEDDGIRQDAVAPGRSAYHGERQASPERDAQVGVQA